MGKYKKDFDRWNEKKKKMDQRVMGNPLFVSAREVWWCSVGVNVGSEIDGKNEHFERPILVIRIFSQDGFLGIPLTSKDKGHRYAVPVCHEKGMSFANTSQLRLFSKKRMLRKIGMVEMGDFKKVLVALKDLF
jgi:mRNA interferase MazF